MHEMPIFASPLINPPAKLGGADTSIARISPGCGDTIECVLTADHRFDLNNIRQDD
jgi:hypothetical protein